jgi:hypothetical protein
LRSLKNSSFVRPAEKSNANCAALAISTSVASSRRIGRPSLGEKDLGLSQYLFTAHLVTASFYGAFADQVNLAMQYALKLLLHSDMIEQTPIRIGGKGDKEINVTVRPETFA